MEVHVPTMLLAVVMVSLTLTIAVAMVSHRHHGDGLRLWALGLLLNTVAFVLYGLRGRVPDVVSVFGANVMLSVTYATFAQGLYQFQQRAAPGWVWCPVVAMMVLLLSLPAHQPTRVIGSSAVLTWQCLLMLRVLAQRRRQTVGRGQYFFMGGLILMAGTLACRTLATAWGGVAMTSLFSYNWVQTMTFLMAMSSTVLLSFGLVLMNMEQADERNRQLLMQDALTGLASRRYVLDSLSRHLLSARRTGNPLTVLMLDIDHFKRVNDLYGHLSGDEALKAVSTRLVSRLRGQDVAGRFGGEEFLMVLPHTDAAGGQVLAESLRKVIADHPVPALDGRPMPLTVSIGVHQYAWPELESPESLIAAADEALYAAKRRGRNRVEVSQHAAAVAGLQGLAA
jgi:diguanylate cyclase (GGDEF)-like protein